MKVASIGSITSATARARGLSVDVEATRHDLAGLIEAIRKFYGA
jgi:uroporphyrinogen-III synthase